ncbi:winged helix-turn-helix domain-containing protein [Halocatena salina]|uniref:Helix-turn-helix domain-containing protein n=1 Tax=Halocatena salina TaxID=2934340 RepID=A0A8U0A5C4_9EURY|nr:helix-turn-helix domain-containing protein [Halocatena salina]UPM44234.1 helix-turn-helix domain-containing protein [Halocatena salina]
MTEKNVEWDRLSLIPSQVEMPDTSTRTTTDDAHSDLPTVLRSLNDEKCRTILLALDGPTSATELCESCEMASSTVYRKLERLGEAKLVREYTEIRRNGPNATLYERAFTRIAIDIDDGTFSLSVDRPETDATDRMATFWSEMKEES